MDHLLSHRCPRVSTAVRLRRIGFGLLAATSLCMALTMHGQSIQTLVGGGSYDGRLATGIGLALPAGIAFDGTGSVLLADTNAHRVLRIDGTTGLVSIVAGNGGEDVEGEGGPAPKAGIGFPKGVCVDGSGNVFIAVAATKNSRIWRVDAATGIIQTFAGTGVSGIGGDGGLATAALLQLPSAVAVDGAGNLYIADTLNNVVRRVDAVTKKISRFAGNGTGSSGGDGGPATQASLFRPSGLAVDSSGNVFISDTNNHMIRRVDVNGIITPYAGTGTAGYGGDNGAATAAILRLPGQIALDATGNLFIADAANHRIRRVARDTGTISSVAGNGTAAFAGDQGPATLASLSSPVSVAVAASGFFISDAGNFRLRRVATDGTISTAGGSGQAGAVGDGGPGTSAVLGRPFQLALSPSAMYIADYLNHRIRRYDFATKIITTVAGTGTAGLSGDGGPAVNAQLNLPVGVALDAQGNLYIADAQNHSIRKVDGTGRITTIAGFGVPGSSGDGGQAVDALLNLPYGLAIDADQNLYIAEFFGYRIRRIALPTGIIDTYAGTGVQGSSGDGGPATSAQLNRPASVTVDSQGNLFIADQQNHKIRRVDAVSKTISTIAGNGTAGFSGDGGSAISASLKSPTFVALDANQNVWITDNNNNRIRKVDAISRTITTVIGSDQTDFSGDDGRFAAAGILFPNGAVFNAKGDLFFSDTSHGRVRAVLACVTVTAPVPSAPPDSATGVATAPTLTWSASPGAFRYDLYLDTAASPQEIVASDLTVTSFVPANLQPGARYFWKVVAKGDRFCSPFSTASSAVRSFTTGTSCQAPNTFDLVAPTDGATGVSSGAPLSWQGAAGAASYDLFLGTSNPPPFKSALGNVTSFTASGLSLGTTYYWYVSASATCDAARRTSSPIRSFTIAGSCPAPGPFVSTSPASGATVAASPTLAWFTSASASSYDLYFGEQTNPPLYLSGLTGTSVALSRLAAGLTYYWRVVARVACSPEVTTSTAESNFVVQGTCAAPGVPAFAFVPSGSVGAAQTYVVSWQAVATLDAGGGYLIERSLNASFSPILDSQQTTATSASFVSQVEGTYYHRVRSVAGCDPTKLSAPSETRSVTIVASSPSVVFTVQPRAVVAALNQKLEDLKTTFVVENLGKASVLVVLGRQEISSVPFFSVVDPLGGDSTTLSLAPRTPKTLEIHFSGPRTDQAGSFQGVIFLTSPGAGLPITPYAFVNLKIGDGAGVAPTFEVGGVASEYATFPAFSGDDSKRPPIVVHVKNPGSTPMELAAEIGPEVWLVPNADWNSTPIPPGGARPVSLFTQRARAPNGSALPRYTYFTVRTTGGASARLLVQDNEVTAAPPGPRSSLSPTTRSYIVPSVVKAKSAIENIFVSKLRLSNAGTDPIQADLFFTPANADGFDTTVVKKATIVVPPTDLVTLTDPLVQIFGLTPNVSGSLEVRAAPEKIGLLTVTSVVDAAASNGGTFGFQLPTVVRGEGARLGHSHVLAGVTSTAASRTNLILAETTGLDSAAVRASLFDKDGNAVGDQLIAVPRLGQKQVSAKDLGAGTTLDAGRIELNVESGGGSVVGLVTVIDNVNDDAVTYIGRPITAEAAPRALLHSQKRPRWAKAAGTTTFVVPAVVNGFSTFLGVTTPYTFQSLMGFINVTYDPATFQLSYDDLQSGLTINRTVNVPARKTIEYKNVLEEVFNIPTKQPSQGPVFIEATSNGVVYCKVFSILASGALGDGFPVLSLPSETVTGSATVKPIYVDGLEQSIDSTRGTRSNLILNEVSGLGPTTAIVRLYEAGNRSQPLAEVEVPLQPREKKQLSSVFSGLGLDSAERRKDRTNVQCVVVAKANSGAGLLSAVVTTTDNRTGDTKTSLLTPSGGVSSTGEVKTGF